MEDSRRWLYFLVLPLIFLTGLVIQSRMILSPDVSWILHVAAEIQAGKQYGVNIFETNPPMAPWLDFPVIFLHKIFLWDIGSIFRGYIYALNGLSIGLSCLFLRRILPANDVLLGWAIPLSLAFCLCFLQNYSFGQRDIIWVTLLLPYLFSAVLALERRPITAWQAVLVGVMAGFATGMKPYFIFPLCLIEGFAIFHHRRFFGWWRMETAVLLAILIGYLACIIEFQPGYLQTVLPLVVRYYFSTVYWSWGAMLTHTGTFFPVSVMVFYLVFRQHDHFPVLGKVLMLGLLGTELSFFLARTPWYYHYYPALFIACVTLIYITLQMIRDMTDGEKNLSSAMIIGSVALFLISWPITGIYVGMGAKDLYFNPIHKIADYISSRGGPRTITAMTLDGTEDSYLPVDMAHGTYLSGLPFFWWQGGMLASSAEHRLSSARLRQDWTYFTGLIGKEIEQTRPHWIVVDVMDPWRSMNKRMRRHAMHWTQDYRLNPELDQALQNYRCRLVLDQFRVYERQG